MKRVFFIFIILLSMPFIAVSTSLAAGDWTGNAGLIIGSKTLNEDDWEPVESQSEVGAEVDFAKRSWPFHIAFAALQSSDEDTVYVRYDDERLRTKIKASTTELRAGIKKIWEPTSVMRPYVGGGLALINAEFESSVRYEFEGVSASSDDQGLGLWINGGIYWTLFKQLNLGFSVGYSKATSDLFDIDAESGGVHGAFCVGYHW